MIDEFRKSINNILSERLTSPFYGTFIFSWAIWNWNIIYLTLFVSEKRLPINKLEYINKYLLDWYKFLWFPLLSSALLILVIPFLANGAYYISLRFNTWKKNQKQKIEGEELLTKAESIALRKEILTQENKFADLIAKKNLEIEELKAIVNEPPFDENLIDDFSQEKKEDETSELKKLVSKVKSDERLNNSYHVLLTRMQGGYQIRPENDVPTDIISLFESNNLITKFGQTYKPTEKGLLFQKMYLEH